MTTLPDVILRMAPTLLFSKSGWRVAQWLKPSQFGAMTLVVDPAATGVTIERGGEVLLSLTVDDTTMALESFLR